MTIDEMQELFEKHEDEFLADVPLADRLHKRTDLAAMLLLDRLVPGEGDMICWGGHDEIAFDTDPEALAKVAVESDIVTLIRLGVRYDEDSFRMFV